MKANPAEPKAQHAAPLIGFDWLRNQAWPLWLKHGIDWKVGAFHEYLDLTTLTCSADYRRLRVAARQVYVFSRAASQGLPDAKDAVDVGLDFLRSRARMDDGGFASRFNLQNQPINQARDLYDHSFVLLAFSAAAAVVGTASVRIDAIALLDYLMRAFPHPSGGYDEGIPPTRPRRQNPHMHLLEALLAGYEAFGDPIFFERARELVEVFVRRLFEPSAGAVPEYFDEELVPQREQGRYLVEPGHHYEWVWLLDWFAGVSKLAGSPVDKELAAISDRLRTFADHHGLDPQMGAAVDGVWSNGAIQAPSLRLWPQTERLKAEARRREGQDKFEEAHIALSRFIKDAPPGLWRERMDPQGIPTNEPAPATSLYHLTTALTDSRVMRRLGSNS